MILRQNYQAIKEKYGKLGKNNVRLTQSTLILIQDIQATKDTYTFPVLESDTKNTVKIEEQRLNINDEFISNEIGFYLGGDVTVETGGANAFLAKRLYTYAPVELNSDFGFSEGVYAGHLQILVNKVSFLEKWDLKKHNYIPRTQFADASVGIPNATQASINFAEHGMYPLQPNITLSGSKKNDLIISLPRAIRASGSNWLTPNAPTTQALTISQMWLVFRGLLGQNASKFQD